MTLCDVASRDHLDMLVTAAAQYGLLLDSTTAAFSTTAAQAGTVATPTEAGQLLLEENLAALRWRTSAAAAHSSSTPTTCDTPTAASTSPSRSK